MANPQSRAAGTQSNSAGILHSEVRIAWDGRPYTYSEFGSFYGTTPSTQWIWEVAPIWPPAMHSQVDPTPMPSNSVVMPHAETRIAWDGRPSTYKEFQTFYGCTTSTLEIWQSAPLYRPDAATVPKQTPEQADEALGTTRWPLVDTQGPSHNVVPPHVAGTSTHEITEIVSTAPEQSGDIEQSSDVEQSPAENAVTPRVAASSPYEVTDGVNAVPLERSDTKEGIFIMIPHAEALPRAASDDTTLVIATALQCPTCRMQLCQPQDLCFFTRYNSQGGHEVHLILKPELPQMPPLFILATITVKGATQSWQCPCGNHLGDTRPVGPNKASMTAFKSESVMLYGQHLRGKKSQWPSFFCKHPFNKIAVRNRDNFHGP